MAGQLWGWGYNQYGFLGDNTINTKSSPVQVITFTNDWEYVSVGYNTVAVKTDGTLWSWGYNAYGQLGDNTTVNKSSPVQTVTGGTDWLEATAGGHHIVAIKTDGSLWVWGYNINGQLGDNTTVHRSSPVQIVAGGTTWSQVACGDRHTAAIKTDNTLWTWGTNADGQLGDNTIVHRSSPVQTVAGGTNWSQVSCGQAHTAAIKTDNTLWVWGGNTNGQLGDNTTVSRSSPVQTVTGGTNWSQVACGFLNTAAIKTDGSLWVWGRNYYGQLGDNSSTPRSSPVQTVSAGTNWKNVSSGFECTSGLKTDNTLWTWGANADGQLGDNTIGNKSSPVQTIAGGTRWSRLQAGFASATVFAIYENDPNQLGVNIQPQAGYSSNPLLVQPTININDSAGSVVRIATNNVTVAVQSGNATLSGTTTVTAIDGIATFTNLVLTGSGPVVLRFTSTGLTLVDSNSFTLSLTLPIIPKRSEFSGKLPTSGQISIGELAINFADKKGYIKKSDGTIVNLFNGTVGDGGTF